MKIKMERTITVYVNITYKTNNNELVQTFNVTTKRKKDLSYLYDSRFLLKNKIDKIISDNLLDNFIKRVDHEDKIEMFYEIQEKPAPLIKVFNIYIPPFLGCIYCSNAEKKSDNGFFYCKIKKKHYQKNGIKRCPVFKTKEKILT